MKSTNFFHRQHGVRSLRVESLETRVLLSADLLHSVAAAHDRHEAVEVGHASPSHTGVASHTTSTQLQTHSEIRLTASLSPADPASATSGMASYQSETEHGKTSAQLVVSVKGSTSTAPLTVAVDGVTVGQITLDANGNGRLKITSNLPAIQTGSVVTVDTLTGKLAVPAPPSGNPGHDHGGEQSETKLRASLVDSVGTATGNVSYESSQENGQTHAELTVRVKGATPGTPLDVVITTAGVSTTVGQISVDSKGNGRLELSANLPAIQAGSLVTVGASVSGTLA